MRERSVVLSMIGSYEREGRTPASVCLKSCTISGGKRWGGETLAEVGVGCCGVLLCGIVLTVVGISE